MKRPRFRDVWPGVAITGLAIWVVVGLWLMIVQICLAVWDPMGAWQAPGIAKVTVTLVSRDPDNKLTGEVLVQVGGKSREFVFSVQEAAELEPDDEVWVLSNYRSHGIRPGHFLLTPGRLVLEYPEPWILLAFWGISRLRKRQLRLAQEAQPKERKVWRDDFHQRSERFAKGPGRDQ